MFQEDAKEAKSFLNVYMNVSMRLTASAKITIELQ